MMIRPLGDEQQKGSSGAEPTSYSISFIDFVYLPPFCLEQIQDGGSIIWKKRPPNAAPPNHYSAPPPLNSRLILPVKKKSPADAA
jgi:hypothetical protein